MSEKAEKPDENKPDEQAEHKRRIRHDLSNLMDELIQDGQEKGMFDNLSGKGKPLNLQQNHYAGDMAFANDLLKEYDVPPAWIQERNGILNEMHALREEIVRQWAWHEREMGEASIEEKGRITIRWDDYCLKWIDQIAKLNKRIVTYNLKRPLENMELFKLTIEDELARAQARRWLR